MPVFRGSRYAGAEVQIVEFAPGDMRPVFGVRKPISVDDVGESLKTYTFNDGEEIDNPSFHFGDRSDLWWVVADINNIVSPLDIPDRSVLRVPNKKFFKSIG